MKPTADTIALHEMAAQWRLRKQDASWTGADEHELERWLQSPAHREAYEGLARTWDDFSQIRRPTIAADAQQTRSRAAQRHPGRDGGIIAALQRAIGGRRFVQGLVAACAVLMAGGWYLYDNTPSYSIDTVTSHDHPRTLELPDGSQIVLNIDSTLKVRYFPRRREVVLDQGEAFFKVAANTGQPFTVASGRSEVRVVGTAFNVRAGPPRLVVRVLEGIVEVRPDRETRSDVVRLKANEGLALDLQTRKLARLLAPADTVGDWRSGQLVFRRAPLAEVALELERYLGKPVTVSGASLGAMPVSGYAATDAPQGFVEALPDLLAVKVERVSGGGYRILPR